MVPVLSLTAFAFYLLNCSIGVLAQLRILHLGILHHLCYALVLITTLIALIGDFHPGLLVSVCALVLFPKARPRTLSHPSLAVIGGLGYLLRFIFPNLSLG